MGAERQTNIHTNIRTNTQTLFGKQFQETRHAPGLTSKRENVTRSDKKGLIAHDSKSNFFTQMQSYMSALSVSDI